MIQYDHSPRGESRNRSTTPAPPRQTLLMRAYLEASERARAAVAARAQLADEMRLVELRDEAGAMGDDAQVELCERALDGSLEALVECSRVLREADARRGEVQS